MTVLYMMVSGGIKWRYMMHYDYRELNVTFLYSCIVDVEILPSITPYCVASLEM